MSRTLLACSVLAAAATIGCQSLNRNCGKTCAPPACPAPQNSYYPPAAPQYYPQTSTPYNGALPQGTAPGYAVPLQ